MEQEGNNNKKTQAVFSRVVRAGRRRTYFFDVRTTRSNDYYITITESKKRFHEDGYDRHKVFLYKEDFNKFSDALMETINHVKEELLPEYDFDEFSNNYEDDKNSHSSGESGSAQTEKKEEAASEKSESEEVKEPEEEKVEVEAQNNKTDEQPPIDDEELKM